MASHGAIPDPHPFRVAWGGVPVRVIHVNTARSWRGGEQQVLYLAEGLAAQGIPQKLVCPPGSPLATRARSAGIDVVERRLGGYVDFPSSRAIAKLARAFEADLLHLHTAQAHAIGTRAARWAGRGGQRPKTVIARRVAYSIFRHSFFRLNRLKYTRGVDRILCITEAVRNVLIEDGLPTEQLVVVPSGIDPARFEAIPDTSAALQAELGVPDGAWVLGSVGALTPEKGHRHLLDAVGPVAEAVPHLHLVIAGTGDERAALESQARALGIADRVTFAGFRDDVPALLRWFDALAFPSLMEGMGTTVLDALCCGLPVVASRAGGIPEVIRDGIDGLLVPPGDPVALAAGLVRLATEPETARDLGATGRARVLEHFTRARMVERTLAAYRALCPDATGP